MSDPNYPWKEIEGSYPSCEKLLVRNGIVPPPVATLAIPVLPVVVGTGFVPVQANAVNVIDTTNGDQHAQFPPAASVPNGTLMILKLVNYGGVIYLDPAGADTVDFVVPGLGLQLDDNNATLILISDGASNWIAVLELGP